MSFTPRTRARSTVLGLAFCGAGLAVSVLGGAPAPAAHAAVACRADPIVTLSNGLVVHLSATIADLPSDVLSVAYTLHAPTGTSVRSVIYPPDPNNIPQTFQFYADNAPSTWDSYTSVNTKATGIAVVATAEVANLAVYTANGLAHQQVQIHVGPDNGGAVNATTGGDNGGKGSKGGD